MASSKMWKRFFAFIIAILMLSTTFLSLGCSIVTRGSDYCYRFLDYICAQDFAKAYEMLADSIKAPETEKEREERDRPEDEQGVRPAGTGRRRRRPAGRRRPRK